MHAEKKKKKKTAASSGKKKQQKKKKTSGKESGSGKHLVIVESPAKSKTINKILGKDYKVLASMGHIIDLPEGKMGIDFEDGFKPEYKVMKGRKKYLTSLKKEAKDADRIYLAADPDREGEAICWHLKNQFSKNEADIHRVSFEEITEKAVKAAFNTPREIDMNKVNAQQARRMLDRIVGYSLSPLLWGKVTRGLSAGRVQSVAVRLIVEREEAIRAFTAEEYWSIDAILAKQDYKPGEGDPPASFKAKLVKHKGEKISIPDKDSADEITGRLKKERFVVADISRRDKKSHPRSPYTTSVMQQDAFNKLNFSANKTMRTAQTLYEGVELGSEGSVGLITYMRTDSVRISDDAQKEAREYISDKYGEKYCPAKPPQYKSKKRAQEAHEAIRPTLPLRHPKEVEKYLSPDEYKLYELVWKRFISSQMKSALFNVLTIHIDAGEYRFRAGGAELKFDGFLKPYRDDSEQEEGMEEIPPLEEDEQVDLEELLPEQHFTKPPPRYTDASLVKDLEEKGIGRPSTYAPIIRTVINRNYIKRVSRSLQPTELGELVNKLLVDNFPGIVDAEFTAKMENELDGIEDGKVDIDHVLSHFYSSFSKKLEEAKDRMKSVKRQVVKTDEVCELCGRPMVIKWGRRGRFLSCSGFPACKNAKSITTGVKCPAEGCDGELVERKSRRGMFYGCTNYPKCTYTTRKLPEGQEESSGQDQQKDEDK
ncbi:MAG: type I DNA topoisomerase [Candidatus Omnitrophica bacterium]|nr:type I DNA topoisomerase [Candidatus Omnitrophota bacterium]